MEESQEFQTLAEFWPFYLGEHRSRLNRTLHCLGCLSALAWIGLAIGWGQPHLAWAALLSGYGFAWVGHFFVEGNRPASFRYPLKSFWCDWIMLAYTLTGRIQREVDALPACAADAQQGSVAPSGS